ncbi:MULTISPECIES: hemin uptake protein HemP [Roseibium]|jgi:hemin uptake protein HemP|uniref:Hemin uptake protein n=4 Tax=Stappiaceae TaxID=2821832 RepID=A0A0M6ZRG0_9HYPH|nr:hemin uptake protein HemP [Roseibium alexandrii]EEE46150.2 Hemin uptake protein [Roseibium alexandrii DFL-11]CTQ64811.1 Hemin uptake protein [Roseibium alexandrii]
MTPSTNSRKQRLSLSMPGARPAYTKVPVSKGKPQLKSDDLFSGTREINILHNDDTYRLTITKQGKLILTK